MDKPVLPPQQLIQVRRRHASLEELGFAVEYFPNYVNRKMVFHTLDVVLLSCVIRGRRRHYIEGQSFVEVGPSVSVTHYDQRHCILTAPAGIEIFNVYLDLQKYPLPILPRELQPVVPLLLPLHPRFMHHLNRIVRLPFADAAELGQLLVALERELKQCSPGYREASEALWKLLLIRCCRRALKSGVQPAHAPTRLPQPRLEQVRQYLDQAYQEPHTLAGLARQAGLGRTYFCRAFRAYTGKTVFSYLIERRVAAAMVRLRNGDEKVLAVGLNCGFRDPAYFNRKFRKIVGMTPTAYRAVAK